MPCIRGLRIPVAPVVAMVADQMTPPEILAELPDLEEEDVAEALRYAAEAVRERELPLRPTAAAAGRESFACTIEISHRGRSRRHPCS
jgi:uncharacterized protein (DUF433 family)